MNPRKTSYRYDREYLAEPDDTEHRKAENFIPTVEFDEEKYHSHHDWDEDKIIDKMTGHQYAHRSSNPNVSLKLLREVEHAFLGFTQCKRHKSRCDKIQETRLENDR